VGVRATAIGDTDDVISVDTARRLRELGVRWRPRDGDRFVVADRDMDEDVFVLSTMTVDVHDLPEGAVIGFNGTTEWALDSVDQQDAVWLPREDQLRSLLGTTFTTLARDGDQWRVECTVRGSSRSVVHADAEEAYARALIALLE
jgi:hypothetical protein